MIAAGVVARPIAGRLRQPVAGQHIRRSKPSRCRSSLSVVNRPLAWTTATRQPSVTNIVLGATVCSTKQSVTHPRQAMSMRRENCPATLGGAGLRPVGTLQPWTALAAGRRRRTRVAVQAGRGGVARRARSPPWRSGGQCSGAGMARGGKMAHRCRSPQRSRLSADPRDRSRRRRRQPTKPRQRHCLPPPCQPPVGFASEAAQQSHGTVRNVDAPQRSRG